MLDNQLRLMDECLPDVPYRQWVFSFPYRLRIELARSSDLLAAVLSLSIRKVVQLQKRRARKLGFAKGQSFSVLYVQRFGSLLTLNPHALLPTA